MAMPPKLIYRFNAIPIKLPAAVFKKEIDKLIIKFIWKIIQSNQNKLELKKKKKNKVGELILPYLKTYHKTIVTKIAWYWYKDRYINQ